MCGLVGAFGKIDERAKIALAYLGTLCSLRGSDSTGYFDYIPDLKGGEQIKYAKTLDDPVRFFSPGERYWNSMVQRRWKKHDPRIFAVHTRLATIGEVTRENAHPFHHGHVLGMHNGTIRNGLEGQDKFKTDSECLYWNVSQRGQDFLEDLTKKAQAAYVMVWLDTKAKTLNFLRNYERPLYMWLTSDKETVFWASEQPWLASVLPNLNLRGGSESLPVDEVWSFDYTSEKVEVKKEKLRPFFHNTPPGQGNGTTGHGTGKGTLAVVPIEKDSGKKWNYKYNCWLSDEEAALRDATAFNQAREAAKRTNMEAAANANDKRSKFPQVIKGEETYFHSFQGVYHSKESYEHLLSCGCRGCNNVSQPYEFVEFLTEKDYVCPRCKYDDVILELVLAELEEEKEDQKMNIDREVAAWK